MKRINSIVRGDLLVDEKYCINGMVEGDIKVTKRGRLTLNGLCQGRIDIEPGGQCKVNGTVAGGIHDLNKTGLTTTATA